MARTRPTKSPKSRKTNTKKPVPTEVSTQPPPLPQANEANHYKYNAFIAFVDDPKLKTPFTVLQSSNILCMESKRYVNDRYLNNKRRKRCYDMAFTNLFTFPCRIFAKALNTVKPVALHNKCMDLNNQFKVLMACKVDVETAYDRLLEANPRKITDGIIYETGAVDEDGPSAAKRALMAADTLSSYSEMEDTQDLTKETQDLTKQTQDLTKQTQDLISETSDIDKETQDIAVETPSKAREENDDVDSVLYNSGPEEVRT